MLAPWPNPLADAAKARLGATPEMAALVQEKFDLVTAIRNVRANYKISPAVKVAAVIVPADSARGAFLKEDLVSLKVLSLAETIEITPEFDKSRGPNAVAVSTAGTVYIPLAGLIDTAAEIAKLKKQGEELEKYIAGVKGKLSNESFVARAPAAVVEAEKAKLAEAEAKLARVNEQVQALA